MGLQIVDAETLPAKSIRRMRYDPGDGSETVEGLRAMGRAMEHLHLGWAVCGAALRLPVGWRLLQLFLDASGLGPREIAVESTSAGTNASDSGLCTLPVVILRGGMSKSNLSTPLLRNKKRSTPKG